MRYNNIFVTDISIDRGPWKIDDLKKDCENRFADFKKAWKANNKEGDISFYTLEVEYDYGYYQGDGTCSLNMRIYRDETDNEVKVREEAVLKREQQLEKLRLAKLEKAKENAIRKKNKEKVLTDQKAKEEYKQYLKLKKKYGT